MDGGSRLLVLALCAYFWRGVKQAVIESSSEVGGFGMQPSVLVGSVVQACGTKAWCGAALRAVAKGRLCKWRLRSMAGSAHRSQGEVSEQLHEQLFPR